MGRQTTWKVARDMTGRLQDRVAIVTGGGRGIGEATARRFASEGALVAIADIDAASGEGVAADLRSHGYRAEAFATDVANPNSVDALVEGVTARFGTPDILVNSAGINVFRNPLSLSEMDWRRCFGVNLEGPWNTIRAVLPGMLAKRAGSIVNVASVHGLKIIPGSFPYPVAKHALIGLTRSLAVEYASSGIRVNAVCPSYVRTRLAVDHFNTFADPAAEERRISELHPAGRLASPDEIATAVLFLASDDCPFIVGECLVVDGGRSLVFHDTE